MIGDFFTTLFYGFLTAFPVLALPVGFGKAIAFLINIVAFVNVFVPIIRLAPIISLIVLVRNWNIAVSMLRFVMRFIPFIG